MSWLIPFDSLTPDQRNAVEADASSHRIVSGGPGSGKTVVLLHRAAELMRRHRLGPDSIRIFAFTNTLCDYIKDVTDLLGISATSIVTIDKWCSEYLTNRMRETTPKNGGAPDFELIRKIVRSDLSSKFLIDKYEVVLIDEALDLSEDSLHIAKAIADHVTLFVDPSQQIYENSTSIETIRSIFNIHEKDLTMFDIFRTTPFVAKLAIALMENPSNPGEFEKAVRSHQVERQKPLFYRAIDLADEQGFLAEKIQGRLKIGDTIGVLFPQKRQVFGWSAAMKERGLDVEDMGSIDLDSPKPKFMTIHSAKGLTFDSVFMPKMNQSSFRKFNLPQQRNMLFVGITRARKWVCLSATGNEIEPLKRLFRYASNAFTIHEPKDRPSATLFDYIRSGNSVGDKEHFDEDEQSDDDMTDFL